MYQLRIFLSLVASAIFTSGCADRSTQSTSNSGGASNATEHASTSAGDDHAHASEGPHYGTLVELGKEEFHAEVVHDAKSVTVYILDSSAKNAVPVDATEVTINILHEGKPEQFKLAASPEAGEPAGKSSKFTLADDELAGHVDEEAASPKLSVTINGTSYRGEIKHDHDHAGPEHAH